MSTADSRTRLGGRYRLGQQLAAGGMASVYRGVDEQLGRPVAIKLLSPPYALDPAFVERFRQEAQRAAALTHPNVITVFDWGMDAGQPYMVMELVDGETLRHRIQREGRLSERTALAIAADVAAGLAEAHRRGIVHRDVKPSNILLDRSGVAKIGDFGIATDVGNKTRDDALARFGSVFYLSPEQALGRPQDTRTDVYGLGVVLYEMLAGAPPFRGASVGEVMHAVVGQSPRRLRALRPDVSPATEDLVGHALARDPARRLSSAGEMQRALEALLARPTARVSAATAQPAQDTRRVRVAAERPRWSSRFRVLAILALVLSTAAALLIRNVPSTAADQRVTVPKVAGLSLADARAAVSAVGLSVQVVQQEPTLDTPAGEVVTQDPHEDRTADRGTTIQVVMSQGVQVPDVVGSQCSTARSRVTASGWSVRPVRWRIANVADFGKVVAQDPAANAVVPRKGEIQVQVAGPVGPC